MMLNFSLNIMLNLSMYTHVLIKFSFGICFICWLSNYILMLLLSDKLTFMFELLITINNRAFVHGPVTVLDKMYFQVTLKSKQIPGNAYIYTFHLVCGCRHLPHSLHLTKIFSKVFVQSLK